MPFALFLIIPAIGLVIIIAVWIDSLYASRFKRGDRVIVHGYRGGTVKDANHHPWILVAVDGQTLADYIHKDYLKPIKS